MTEFVFVPRKHYEFLQDCARILYEDVTEQFSPAFIRRVRAARRDIARGKGKVFRTRLALRAYDLFNTTTGHSRGPARPRAGRKFM